MYHPFHLSWDLFDHPVGKGHYTAFWFGNWWCNNPKHSIYPSVNDPQKEKLEPSCVSTGEPNRAAADSSTLTWKIPWMEEPGGLQPMGSRRVGHNWVTSLSLFTFMHWRRKWQPIPMLLPGESQGWGSLVGCRLRGRTESDTTKVT